MTAEHSRTRLCTVCLLRGEKRHTEFVARWRHGLEWFECGGHEAREHGEILGTDTSDRVLTPLDDWLRAHGLVRP